MNRIDLTILLTALALASIANSGRAQVSELHALTFSNPEQLGLQADAAATTTCCYPQLSHDGRFVLFMTSAVNLVERDHNNNIDMFVRDRLLGTTTRANVRSDGQQGRSGDAASNVQGAISADGDLVVFASRQSDLVDGDTNQFIDLFLHRRSTGVTTRILGTGGVIPNGVGEQPSLSGDGRFIVFVSSATNLLPDAATGTHVYLLDQNSGDLERITVTPGGTASTGGGNAPGVSDDGRFVIFKSGASDLVPAGGAGNQLFVRDRQLGLTRRLSEPDGVPVGLLGPDAMISGDGSLVVFDATLTGSPISEIFVADVSTGVVTRASVDNANNPGTERSAGPSISRDGQRVVFSTRSALVPGGAANTELMYLRDLDLQTTSMVLPNHPDIDVSDARISGDGQTVSFLSFASTLVANDTNGKQDQFAGDLISNEITRVNLADSSGPFPSRANGDSSLGTNGARQLSTDGRFLVTGTTAKNLGNGIGGNGNQIAHIDRVGNVVRHVSTPVSGLVVNSAAFEPAISADGRFVVFRSSATNLVTGDNNSAGDVFWRDMDNNLLERVTLGPGNIQALGAGGGTSANFPSVSDDGNLIAYSSLFTNLVVDDTNAVRDIFVRDRGAASTTRVSVDSVGTQSNGHSDFSVISADGRFVVFTTLATNLVVEDTGALQKIIRHDRQTGATELVSIGMAGAVANDNGFSSAISADGTLVAFSSAATNLVSGDSNARTDIFVRDMSNGTTTRVSADSQGVQGNGTSSGPSISADGRYVSFSSIAVNLVPGDTNNKSDVFLHDRQSGQTTRVSVDPQGRQADFTTEVNLGGQMTPDGSHVAVATSARKFDLLTGVSGGDTILLAKPASTQILDTVFANGFD